MIVEDESWKEDEPGGGAISVCGRRYNNNRVMKTKREVADENETTRRLDASSSPQLLLQNKYSEPLSEGHKRFVTLGLWAEIVVGV